MRCVFCGHLESKVIDSRSAEDGSAIRRRRECLECGKRFTTYEKVESMPLIVVKKDKTRQQFDRQKLLNGLLRACEKRHVTLEQLENVVDNIETSIQNTLKREISSVEIGEMVMNELKNIDEVAYVRFASVFREFKTLEDFENILREQKKKR